jgi:hypothetical protein
LSRLGERGFSFGKNKGQGLGIYSARKFAEASGGTLHVESALRKGTTVSIRLPRAKSPDWFVPELKLSRGGAVVVLDDDSSIHQIWRGRFETLGLKNLGVETVHLSTPSEFRAWVHANRARRIQPVYLVDFELLGQSESGLSLIESLGIGLQSILVTSRCEELSVMEGCRRLSVRLIPKGLAGFVPVSVVADAEKYDAVLIDDEPIIGESWRLAARAAGKNLGYFETAEDFYRVEASVSRSVPVYVDCRLKDGNEGLDVTRRLHEMGFIEIYLATGYGVVDTTGMPWIKAVIGKRPVW